jgi:N-acetylglucosamine-6-phosphate deacetylase
MTGLSVYSQPDVVVTNAKVCTPFRYLENYKIAIRDGRILRIRKAKDGFENAQVIDAEGNLVIPGLIDTHIHGIGGFDFRQGKVAIVNIAKILPRFGVTTFLDTLYAVPLNQIGLYTEEARSLMGQNLGAQLLGIHLEGPFFNPNFRGFARRENLAWPSSKIVQDLIQSCHGVVRLVTLSPELDGAVEMIKALTEHGIVTALGHSGAERKQVTKAIEAGLSHVTHISYL